MKSPDPNTSKQQRPATRTTNGTTANTNRAAARPAARTTERATASTNRTARPAVRTTNGTTANTSRTTRPATAKQTTQTAARKTAKGKDDNNKKKTILIAAITATVTLCCCILVICLCVRGDGEKSLNSLLRRKTVDVNPYSVTTRVGASYEDLGTTKRTKPIAGIWDGGLKADDGTSAYPVYGSTKALSAEQKQAIVDENNSICARPTQNASGVYDKMDKDGYLYTLDGTPVLDAGGEHRRLYQHSASVGLYGGNVSASEEGVIKSMTFQKRSYNSYYNVTGLYAPAGEVIKVQMSEADMDATGGIVIHIGQALYNGQANNIWTARDFNRMPVILNTMNMTKQTSVLEDGVYTCYVGSFLGGPIYVRDNNATFGVTISGAVNYSHFILGVTTKEEFEKNAKSSAPYFDLEVWESGVLHSGPKSYAAAFDYDALSKAAVLWEKVSLVSTRMTNQGIVFLYDPFVAAGAAVAFPGRRSVNCPLSWMTASLNYDGIVSAGSWGNFHEYHHNFQGGWGFGYTGEVTNNALNLVSYSLFTKISSSRSVGAYGAAGLSGWNTYTSAPWALQRVNDNNITSTDGLAVYATLLHNLGQDAFIKSKAQGVGYLDKWAETTHLDFSYFATLVKDYSTVEPTALKQTDYHAFVPVSCVYQTGRSYLYDGEKKYIQTMQPYAIPVGEPFKVDLTPYKTNAAGQYESGSIVIGKGLSYRIKAVNTRGINGTFERTDEKDVYLYTPAADAYSGKIIVTLEIDDTGNSLGGKVADDVDLVLEFQNSHELNKFTLHRTVYEYADGALPESAEKAFTDGYAGNIAKTEQDNVNVSQNSNTDVWLYETSNKPESAPDTVVRKNNSVIEVSGKLLFTEAGKYRIVLRGRWNAALFLSFDGGKTYTLAAKLNKEASDRSPVFSFAERDYYYDFETSQIKDAGGFIYFKSVLLTKQSSFMGLGFIRWEPPMYSTKTEIDGAGNEVTVYVDEDGNPVSANEVENAVPIEPTQANKVAYATAYRSSYVPDKAFESDYFYKKDYTYSYRDDTVTLDGSGNNHKSPDDPMFQYKGAWQWKSAASAFGHVNVGGKDATLEFTFEGTRFILITSKRFGNSYTVYIDGKEVSSSPVQASENSYAAHFLSPELSAGKHTVVIRCNGEANIGSIALF